MITLKTIRWTNFLSTGNYFTEVDLLAARTTLISGNNGAGKSTIMDAICYGLFGKPFRRVNKPELVNFITNKNMLVEIEFSTESGDYKIRRGMKPYVFEIFSNGQLIDQAADQRDYQRVLEQNVLKIDYKTFIQKVIIGSANFTPFMQLPAAARRQVIEDLLDIQVFTQMNILLKADIQENKEQLQDNEYQSKLLEKTIDLYKEHNAKVLQDNAAVIRTKQEQVKKYSEENERLAKSLNSFQAKLEKALECRVKRDSIVKKINELHKEQTVAKAQAEQQTKNMQFLKDNDHCKVCGQAITAEHKHKIYVDMTAPDSVIFKLKNLEKEIAAAEEEFAPFEKLDEIIRSAENKSAEWINQINLNNRFIKNLEGEISQLQEAKSQIKSYSDEEKNLKSLNKSKQFLLSQRELYNVALMLLKDGGIKANIIKQYIPIINKLINKYLEVMEFFCQFEVDENFKETIKARYRDESSYESFSEGEKMRIDLALLFTWREIARLRNSSSCNLLILDEIMDSSLDASGTEEFLKIIQQLAANNNVIIISHKSDQIADKFERVIQFETVKNFGRIKTT